MIHTFVADLADDLDAGLYWFRAAHERAQATRDFTAAVSILVK